MPARKHTPDFTACTQFGLRYSTLGKRIAASDPYREGENPREVTSTMNLYELCEALDIELTEEQAEKEAEYIYENRRQFYKNHPYMEKRAIAQCYDGPVFPDDVVYRRSNCEKYTVRKDGSIINTSGTVEIKTPNWEGFVHIAPKKHEKVATFTKGMPRKTNDKSPAITLPKQDNPLVKGEYKTRTPEEESRAKAKQREAIRKEVAKTAEEEGKARAKERGIAWEDATNRIMERKMKTERGGFTISRGEIVEEMCAKLDDEDLAIALALRLRSQASARLHGFEDLLFWGDMARVLSAIPTDLLQKELAQRTDTTEEEKAVVKEHYLGDYNDADLVEELRRRGYEVTATKTINL